MLDVQTPSLGSVAPALGWLRERALPLLLVLVTLKGIHSPNFIACVKISWERGSSSGGEGIEGVSARGDLGSRSLKGRALGWGFINRGEKH